MLLFQYFLQILFVSLPEATTTTAFAPDGEIQILSAGNIFYNPVSVLHAS
jgi:hypothetical protein